MNTDEAIALCPEGRAGFNRRQFLQGVTLFGGMTILAANGVRYSFAASTTEVPDVIITLVLRGGFDSLSAVVPTDEKMMSKARGQIAIPNSSLIPIDRDFGFHPALKSLTPLWEAKELAIINTVGPPTHSRSHFQEISDVAYAAYGEKDKSSGWMARFLDVAGTGSVVQSVGLGSTTKQLFGGKKSSVAVGALENFKLEGIFGYRAEDISGFIDETHGRWSNPWAEQAKSTIQALDLIAKTGEQKSNVKYPNTGTGRRLKDVAALLKAGIGVRAVDVEFEGDWDMHANIGTLESGWLTNYLADFAGSISAFREDLGVLWSRVTIVTVTEFGRRVGSNQSNGTEHGWGSSMFIAGGGVNGGKIHGRFPGLDDQQLKDGDLVVTADYRSVLSEILTRRVGVSVAGVQKIFPNFRPEEISVLKHLSDTPLPTSFPQSVINGLGTVMFDPMQEASPTPTPTPAESTSPTPTPMPAESTSPTPINSASAMAVATKTASKPKKTITCVKNGKSIKVSGVNPKCPTGYKIKK